MVDAVSTGNGYGYYWRRNGKFYVPVGLATRTAGRLAQLIMCILNSCLQWFKVSLQTLTTADSYLTYLFHDCYHTLPVKCDVKRP